MIFKTQIINGKSRPYNIINFHMILCLYCLFILYIITGCEPILIFEPVDFIGGYGSNIGQFRQPKGINLERVAGFGDVLFVADYGNNRVQAIPLDKRDKSYAFGGQGSGQGQFNGPIAVAITRYAYNSGSTSDSANQRIYVADSKNNRIQKYDIGGNYILSWGESGSGPGQFNTPLGIDIDYEGHIYVVDSGNNRIQVFDTLGNFVRMWGQYGQDSGRFDSPIDLSVVYDYDSLNTIYIAVTDYGNNRVQLFDTTGHLATIIANIPRPLGITYNYLSILICGADKNITEYDYSNGDIKRETVNEMGAPYDLTRYTYISDQATHRIYDYGRLF